MFNIIYPLDDLKFQTLHNSTFNVKIASDKP